MSHTVWFGPAWLFPITLFHFFSSICHLIFIVLSNCPHNFSSHPINSCNNPTYSFTYSVPFLLEILAVENETNTLSWGQKPIAQWHIMIYFSMVQQPLVGQGLLIIEASRLHWHHTRWDYSGRVINPMQRHQPDNTHNTRDVLALSGDSNPHSQQATGRRPTS